MAIITVHVTHHDLGRFSILNSIQNADLRMVFSAEGLTTFSICICPIAFRESTSIATSMSGHKGETGL
jgi:hypothetical protein